MSFELSQAQRTRVRQVVTQANRAIADQRVARSRERMLAELERLAGRPQAARALPSAADIEAAFSAMTDVETPSSKVEEFEQRLVAASTEKAAEDRTALTRVSDPATSQAMEALLARLPSRHDVPAAVATAAVKVRLAEGPGRAAALEALRRLVKAEVDDARRRTRARVELDHADAVLRVLIAEDKVLSAQLRGKAEQLAERVTAAEVDYLAGDAVATGELVTAAVALQQNFEREQRDLHALRLLQETWRGLGYELADVDDEPGFLARNPGEGQGVWVGLVGGYTRMTQVKVEGEGYHGRPQAEVHEALCSAAREVENRATADGLTALLHDVDETGAVSETLVVAGQKGAKRTSVRHLRNGGRR